MHLSKGVMVPLICIFSWLVCSCEKKQQLDGPKEDEKQQEKEVTKKKKKVNEKKSRQRF